MKQFWQKQARNKVAFRSCSVALPLSQHNLQLFWHIFEQARQAQMFAELEVWRWQLPPEHRRGPGG